MSSPTSSAIGALVFGFAYCLSGEDHTAFRLFCWMASAVCLAHAVNEILYMLERPIPYHKKQQQQAPKMEFPWKTPTVMEEQEESTCSYFCTWQDLFSFLDLQARRHKKWEMERRKWRELQHQLSILRTVRAQRISRGEVAPPEPIDQATAKALNRTNATVPWKSHNAQTSIFGNLRALVQAIYKRSYWVRWMLDPDYRGKAKWEKERLKWRELQQQLGVLRVIRSSRKAAGREWKSQGQPIQVANLCSRSFPWKEETSTNCGAMEWCCSSFSTLVPAWYSGWMQWILDPQYRLALKWDEERKRWRELQQQLGSLRVIRSTRSAAGTQWKSTSDQVLEVVHSKQSFPWKENTSTNCGPVEWLLSTLPRLNMSPLGMLRWLFEAEYRRTLKWDEERRRWRELQQQLGSLRVIRASREAAGAGWKSDEVKVASTKRRFPWLDEGSGGDWVQCLLALLSPESHRKRRWDHEREKWRELQQQLGKLRSIRAQNEEGISRTSLAQEDASAPQDQCIDQKKFVALKYVLS